MKKRYFTEKELKKGYAAMAEINLQLANEAFQVEVEALKITEERILMMTNVNWREAVELMGYEVTPYYEQKLNFLINTEDDLLELINTALEINHPTLLPVLNRIRKNRVDENLIPVNKFVARFNNNKIESLESLFQEQVIEDDIKKINLKEITPDRIYEYHLSNPYNSLLTFLSLQ